MNFKNAATSVMLITILSINPIFMLMNASSSNPTLADNDGKNFIFEDIKKEDVRLLEVVTLKINVKVGSKIEAEIPEHNT
jgi:hypothetical protein